MKAAIIKLKNLFRTPTKFGHHLWRGAFSNSNHGIPPKGVKGIMATEAEIQSD